MSLVYCTILARNYLAQALALHASIQRHEPGRQLVVLLLDGEAAVQPHRSAGLRIVTPEVLGLSDRRLLELRMSYDVVEFATSVKPLLLEHLLGDFEQAVYLDPDTYLVSPLEELPAAIDAAGGLLLTPHFLEPISPDSAFISEMHSLNVGINNLGFCATSRAAIPFLRWWWSHLDNECLVYPLLGLFVDQKWVDVGVSFFPSAALRHYGYNVGPWNLHERAMVVSECRISMAATGEPLRLFHFSGFDPVKPTELSSRLGFSTAHLRSSSEALEELCVEYAGHVTRAREEIGPAPDYAYNHDTRGRYIPKRLRRAYRTGALKPEATLPSPFLTEEADAFARWRRRARSTVGKQVVADAAIATKYVLPDEYVRFRRLLPQAFTKIRARLLAEGHVRR